MQAEPIKGMPVSCTIHHTAMVRVMVTDHVDTTGELRVDYRCITPDCPVFLVRVVETTRLEEYRLTQGGESEHKAVSICQICGETYYTSLRHRHRKKPLNPDDLISV